VKRVIQEDEQNQAVILGVYIQLAHLKRTYDTGTYEYEEQFNALHEQLRSLGLNDNEIMRLCADAEPDPMKLWIFRQFADNPELPGETGPEYLARVLGPTNASEFYESLKEFFLILTEKKGLGK